MSLDELVLQQISGRLDRYEKRLSEVEQAAERIESSVNLMRQEQGTMTDAYRAARNALYSAAAIIVAVAAGVILFGSHP